MIEDTGYRRSEHYRQFHALRARTVRLQAMEEVDGVRRPRDLSAAKWQIRLRAYRAAVASGQAFLLDGVATKVVGTTAGGDTGVFQLAVNFAVAAVGDAVMEAVAVDTDTVVAGTPSGKYEEQLDLPWEIVIHQAAGTA